ncbi:MAG: 50S ribosomal protein L24 [Nitrososphaeria archaeon]|jgi:large subunit ribosomal protein L24
MSSDKPSKVRSRMFNAPLHKLGKIINARLSDDLRTKYAFKTARIKKGDSVKIVRGEYAGVEGKVTGVHVENGTISVEGVYRERVKGEQTPVKITASKVMITSLNLDDKLRKTRFESKTPKSRGA